MFQGFSPETIEFLWGIRFNNEKTWFEAHKPDYLKYLYQPMKELGADVQGKLLERFPKSQLNLKISRIYRDARRLFGRGPYKDHLWLTLFRWDGGEEGARPALWFEITPDEWSYGMGFWCAKAAVMEQHRARMDRDYKPLLKLATAWISRMSLSWRGQNTLEKSRLLIPSSPIGTTKNPCPSAVPVPWTKDSTPLPWWTPWWTASPFSCPTMTTSQPCGRMGRSLDGPDQFLLFPNLSRSPSYPKEGLLDIWSQDLMGVAGDMAAQVHRAGQPGDVGAAGVDGHPKGGCGPPQSLWANA